MLNLIFKFSCVIVLLLGYNYFFLVTTSFVLDTLLTILDSAIAVGTGAAVDAAAFPSKFFGSKID